MEKENNKKKVSILICAIVLVLILIVGITYAYLSSHNKVDDRTTQAGTLLISYEDDNLNSIRLDNIQPIYDKDIKEKASKISFKVNNIGTAKAYVDINITDISLPPELADLEFKWALYSGEEKISNGNFRNVLDNKLLLTNNQEITSSKSYELYIWISENELDQSDMMEKTFSAKITVVGHQNKQAELLSKVIKDNNPLQEGQPDFSKVAVSQDYYDTLPESSPNMYTGIKSKATVENGLYQATDDDGETYYFRGNIENNYLKIEGLTWPNNAQPAYLIPTNKNYNPIIVNSMYEASDTECDSFYSNYGYSSVDECIADIKEVGAKPGEDMLFRIVRINGDGTIRIIADGSIGNIDFNNYFNDEKYVGYTYNNSKPNVQDGEKSKIKEYLDSWYETNMTDYDKILASTRYCNDTTTGYIGKYATYYGAYDRINTNSPNPTYICPNTDKLYGGEYDLKIGLLSADEAVFAGGKHDTSNSNYYLFGSSAWRWLMSPYTCLSDYNEPLEYSIHPGDYLSEYDYYTSYADVPVFNLRSDTLFTQGNGEVNNPYVVKSE